MPSLPPPRGAISLACAALFVCACRSSDAVPSESSTQVSPEGGPVVRLEKSGCFGPCPIYAVEVDREGNVAFEGQGFVGSFGKQRGKVDPKVVSDLATALADDGFFTVETVEKCDKGAKTDNATWAISLSAAGKHRRISQYLGSHCRLERIIGWADRIDVALNVAPWLRCDGPCTRAPDDPDTSGDAL